MKKLENREECSFCGSYIGWLQTKLREWWAAFDHYPKREMDDTVSYCSFSCAYEAGVNHTQETNQSAKKTQRNCRQCGIPFATYICQDKIYCSRKCCFEHHSTLNPTGKSRKRKKQAVVSKEVIPLRELIAEESTPLEELFPLSPLSPLVTPDVDSLSIPDPSWSHRQKRDRISALSQW